MPGLGPGLRARTVNLKDIGRRGGPSVRPWWEHMIVVKRTGQEVHMEQGRDYWYHDLARLPMAATTV